MRARRILTAVSLLAAAPLAAEPVYFTGATVHPVSGPPIESAVLVVEGERILSLDASTEVPAGAATVDLAGKHVYPGFVHPGSVLGLIEIGSVRGTVDTTELGEVNSHIRAEVAFNADSMLLPVTASGGVLTAHVVPAGGVFRGTSAVMRIDGWNWEDMTLAAPVAMHIAYPRLLPPSRSFRPVSEEEIEKQKKEALEVLDRTLDDARAYRKARRAEGAAAADFDPRLEALLPVLDGELPVWLHAEERTQIEGALDWAAEQELDQIVLVTGPDAALVAERLAAEEVPVILDGVLRRPDRSWQPYDTAYTAAARLHAAGVAFAIGDGSGGFGAANARNLPFEAAMAAAFGLPREVALASVTLAAAEILGVGDRLGSLDAGKEATFLVTDGDPLEIRTTIERAWLAGRELDLDDRQKGLYRKYRDRPRPGG